MGFRITLAAVAAGLLGTYAAPAHAQTTCTPARAMILFDRSTSMHLDLIGDQTKWDLATAAVKEIASTYDQQIELGLSLFPAAALSCSGATLAVAPAMNNGDKIAAGLVGPVRNMFTPIGAALASMAKEPSLNVANRPKRYVILVTDGHEDCPVDADEQSVATTVATVNTLKGMGITTFVVGFGQPSNGDGVDAGALNQLAMAGGKPIAGCNPQGVNPGAADLCYYQADDYDALVLALDSIAVDVSTEICDGLDNNCNGETDEGCECIDGTVRECGVTGGACRPGTQTCRDGKWSACEGGVVPRPETCDKTDDDCDGTVDEGCECARGEMRECGGPSIGVCKAGMQTCRADGTWGPCAGSVGGSTETCDGKDNDCNGQADDVMPGSTVGLCGPDARCSGGKCIPGPGRLAGAGMTCSVGHTGSALGWLLPLALALGLVFARRRKAAALVLAAAGLSTTGGVAQAQAQHDEVGFALDRFEPSERGSRWFVLDSADWSGDLRPSVGLTADFADKPLVVYDMHDVERTVVVNRQLFTHVGASLVVKDRFRFGVGLPIVLDQGGAIGMNGERSFPPPQSAAAGDLRLSAAARVLSVGNGLFNLAGGLSVYVPTGSREQYSGDEAVRVMPHVLAGGHAGYLQYAAKVGLHYRSVDDAIDGAPIGSEVVAAAAVGARLMGDKLLLGPEVYASTVVSDSNAMFDGRTSPLEALLGVHYDLPGGWRARAGGGMGFGRGMGTPVYRLVAGLEWTPAPAAEPPPSDRDRDLIFDREDACPDMPGIRTNDPATNGCPPDRDHDGILDAEDACPEVAGVRSDDPKLHGCPPPPPPPAEPPPPPPPAPEAKVRIERDQIVILEQIQFEHASATILSVSEGILGEVKEVLEAHAEITFVRVEGHTDSVGGNSYNKKLSQRRAQSVVAWLVGHGIARGRLGAAGFGEERPIDTNRTAAGRQNNRRVEFHIAEQEQVAAPAAEPVPTVTPEPEPAPAPAPAPAAETTGPTAPDAVPATND